MTLYEERDQLDATQ